MFNTIGMKSAALGLLLLLTGVAVGVAGAQIAGTFQRTGSTSTGLFTIHDGEAVNFSVSLDDDSSGPVGRVLMRLIDDQGTVKVGRLVSLAPGRSATLPYNVPGRYRAQFEKQESTPSLSDRRSVAGTVEVFDVDDVKLRTRFVCGENIPPIGK